MPKEARLAIDIHRAKILREELRSIEGSIEKRLTRRPITRADESAMVDMQVRADSVYQELGRRAPPSMPYEYPDEYRVRLLKELQPHSATWKNIDLEGLSEPAALNLVEQQILQEARADAISPVDIKPHEIRPIVRLDAMTGHTVTRFAGRDTHFVKQFSRVPRQAIFYSKGEYEAMTRDADAARHAAVMREHVKLARQGLISTNSETMPVPSTANPVIEVSKAVVKKLRGA